MFKYKLCSYRKVVFEEKFLFSSLNNSKVNSSYKLTECLSTNCTDICGDEVLKSWKSDREIMYDNRESVIDANSPYKNSKIKNIIRRNSQEQLKIILDYESETIRKDYCQSVVKLIVAFIIMSITSLFLFKHSLYILGVIIDLIVISILVFFVVYYRVLYMNINYFKITLDKDYYCPTYKYLKDHSTEFNANFIMFSILQSLTYIPFNFNMKRILYKINLSECVSFNTGLFISLIISISSLFIRFIIDNSNSNSQNISIMIIEFMIGLSVLLIIILTKVKIKFKSYVLLSYLVATCYVIIRFCALSYYKIKIK